MKEEWRGSEGRVWNFTRRQWAVDHESGELVTLAARN